MSAPVSGMHLQNRIALALLTITPLCTAGTFAVLGSQAGAWPAILSSVGHIAGSPASADILVAPAGTPASADWRAKVEHGAALILEGSSPLASSFGFQPLPDTVSVVHIVDVHNPAVPVVWEKPVELQRYEIPAGARVFTAQRGADRSVGTRSTRFAAGAPVSVE